MKPISRRRFLAGLACGATAAVVGPRAFAQGRRKPNVVLIMADDLGYDELGCFGSRRIKTPNIDALAAGGIKFTDYHSNGAVCSPTRAAMLTGRYQQRCGVEGVITAARHRHTGMPLDEVTFAEVMKSAGYVTAIFGKWHLGYPSTFNPVHQGFDFFRGYVSGNVDFHSHIDQGGYTDWWEADKLKAEEGYTTDLITAHACRFIEAHTEKPFVLYLPNEAPHYPYQGRKDPPVRANPDGEGKLKRLPERQDVPGAYKEMVEVMDEGVGKVVATLKRLGLEKDTLVVFCSDNGACRAGTNGPLRGFKGSLWEGGHRVPAVACWPGKITPGSVTGQTVLSMDWFATMAALGAAKLPGGHKLDGVSLLGLLTEGKALRPRDLFWRAGTQKAIRRGPWKLLVNPRSSGPKKKGAKSAVAGGKSPMLFNLQDDLGETKDLAKESPQLVKQLQAALTAWEKDVTVENPVS